MPKLAPTSWKKLVAIFRLDGFIEHRISGDHIVMVKKGVARPIIIPKYNEVGLDIIQSNLRTAGMT